MAKPKPPPSPEAAREEVPPDTIEEVAVEAAGAGRWRVVSALFVKVPGSEEVLEKSVSLPVARARAISWRARNGGVGRGIP